MLIRNFLSVCHSVLHVYNFWCIFVYMYHYVEGIIMEPLITFINDDAHSHTKHVLLCLV